MGDYENAIDGAFDDDIEQEFSYPDKMAASHKNKQ